MTAENKRERPRGPQGPRVGGGSAAARRLAAAILDVLAGGRTPTEAAAALAISPPRYYALESRALEGLVAACEPRRRGKTPTPEREIERLRREVDSLRREGVRRQTLLRAAQRAAGLPPPPAKPSKKRRRRPVVRALRAAKVLGSCDPAAPAVPEVSKP